ncbi:MAG: mechanosensitive ion channel [Deltaproteobacteria bacterium]|nr:mechanosensitive ion channel [Deltaproteobacteria bacterium]
MDQINSLLIMLKAKVNASLLFFKSDSSIINNLYIFILIAGVTYVCWLCISLTLSFVLKRSEKYEFIKINESAYKTIRKICAYLLYMLSGTVVIQIYEIELIERIFYAALILMIAKPLVDFINIMLDILEKKVAAKTDTDLDDIIFNLLKKFSGVIIFLLAIISSLGIIGVNIMPFVAGAGVAGVAIGFAAKDTLSNLIAGVLLIVDRPFEVGDRIEVWSAPSGSSTWGDVIDIGLRATKIKTTDNIIIIIPNNEIMTRDIVNYTLNSAAIRVRVNIGVAYETDIDKAKEAIVKVAESCEWSSKTPKPKVVVRNFGETAVDLQLRVWIDEARMRMSTISYITDNVKLAFDEAGIEIPYPRRDIYMIKD